jgi:hypothetical protein
MSEVLAPRKQRRTEARKARESFQPVYNRNSQTGKGGEPVSGQSRKHKKVLMNDEVYKDKRTKRDQEEVV